MTNECLAQQVVQHAPALRSGEFAVVAKGAGTGEWWNTGRIYSQPGAAFARQTREMNRNECSAWVVKRHAAGVTVYLAVGTTLATVTGS